MAEDARDLPTVVPRGAPITIDFEGAPVRAFAGEPVAAALWAAGVRTLARSPKYHRPRGPFCLDGHCGSCAMRIDGRPNLRACMTPARQDLRCERQNAIPSADLDVLGAADWLFPRGMDHHTLLTRPAAANRLFVTMVRRMGGSGLLPDAPADELPSVRDLDLDVAVVGAGPAGLAAARAVREARPSARVTVFDEQATPGGSLWAEPDGGVPARDLTAAATRAGAQVLPASTALAYYPDDEQRPDAATVGVLAVLTPQGLRRVRARRFVYATGGYDQNLPFADNDRPGVISARACGRLAFALGIRPGRRVLVVDGSPFAGRLMAGLAARGIDCERVDLAHAVVERALGGGQVTGLSVVGAPADAAPPRRLRGDVVAVATPAAPASELPRHHGAAVRFDVARGGFAVEADGAGATSVPGVLACGDVTGYMGPEAALAAGARAGREAAHDL